MAAGEETSPPETIPPPPVLKASHIVKPSEPTPNHTVYLSGFDQIQGVTHAPTLYFYPPTPTSLSQATQTLKKSLSKALVFFYPLAGRVTLVDKGRAELHCKSHGALLLEAESQATLEDYKTTTTSGGYFLPTPHVRSQLIPSFDYATTPLHEIPLYICQVTKFKCGGICLGMGVCHTVGDGQSALHFIREWAKIARGYHASPTNQVLVAKPFLDRSIMADIEASLDKPVFSHPEFDRPPLLIGKKDDLEQRKKPSTITMLKVTKEQMEKLKNRTNGGEEKEQEEEKNPTPHASYSRYETLCGHIWRTACKARGLSPEQTTRFDVAADVRQRLNPPLPEYYFGNTVIHRAAAFARAGDLVSNPISYAAGKLRETVSKLSEEYVRSFLAYIKNIPDLTGYRGSHTAGCSENVAFYGNPNMEGTSWMSLPMYGADFGWGEEVYMGPGTVAMDGKFYLLPSRDGDGSFNVLIRLQIQHMEAFKKFFYDDM